jgi:hypothetical protein
MLTNKRNHRLLAPTAENIIIVSTIGTPLEKRTAMLDKLCGYRLGRKLTLQAAHLTFKSGAFLLKLGNLLFERLRLQPQHGVSGNVCNEFEDGFHKSVAMTPNDQELSHAAGDLRQSETRSEN